MYTFSGPPPPQKVYTSTFFKWIIFHENDKKNRAKILKVYGINFFFPLTPLKEYVLYTVFNIDNYGWPLR